MAHAIVPVAELGARPPEAGRIRLGVKTKIQSGRNAGKDKPAAISTLRFTSVYRDCIEAIAEQFGGDPRPWDEPSARQKNQWEVITTEWEIPVLLPRDPLSTAYELWSGGGRQRHCDGIECMAPQKISDTDYEYVPVPCLCRQEGMRSCHNKSRLMVVLPTIPFRGVWRLETGSDTALKELPSMVAMIEQLQANGRITRARLTLMSESKMTPVGRRNFCVPRLSMDATPLELVGGGGGVQVSIGAGGSDRPALPAGSPPAAPDPVDDDDVADAEIVPQNEVDDLLLHGLWNDAEHFGLDPERFVAAMRRAVGAETEWSDAARGKVRQAREKMARGQTEPMGFKADGSIQWRKMK